MSRPTMRRSRSAGRIRSPCGHLPQRSCGWSSLAIPARNIPPCASCHRPGSGGPIETPILAEQHSEYLVQQMQMYASGQRRNDVYARMRTIAAKLTPAEIEGLAAYYRAGFR